MRIDDPILALANRDASRDAARDGGRSVGGEGGAQAWLMEMERARRDSWQCDATAPGEAASAIDAAAGTTASTAGTTTVSGGMATMGTATPAVGERPLRPYGVEPFASQLPASLSPTGAAAPPAALPQVGKTSGVQGNGVGATVQSLAVPPDDSAAVAPITATDGSRGAGRAAEAAMTSASSRGATATGHPVTDRAVAADRAAAAAAATDGEQQPVRLHVERGVDGQLNAWLGVDRGAAEQAAAVVAHWRDDTRRRGESVGTVHINGQALARDGAASDRPASAPAHPPATMPAFIDSNAGAH